MSKNPKPIVTYQKDDYITNPDLDVSEITDAVEDRLEEIYCKQDMIESLRLRAKGGIRYWLCFAKLTPKYRIARSSRDEQTMTLDEAGNPIPVKNKKVKDKATLVEDVRRIIRSSIGNRAKESLLVDFINQTDLDKLGDKATVIDTFFSFAQAEQQREAEELINSESLNIEAAKRYITNSIKREFASDNGTELNAILPKMSPLNPQFLVKKQSVLKRIAAFVEKFKGVGGEI